MHIDAIDIDLNNVATTTTNNFFDDLARIINTYLENTVPFVQSAFTKKTTSQPTKRKVKL